MTDIAPAPTTRAVVLGGGGATGMAWLVGMIRGLSDAGIDLAGADLVVGTSAGSIVGSLLADGVSIDDMEQRVVTNDPTLTAEAMASLDMTEILTLFAAWETMPDATAESMRAIGAMAAQAKTISAPRFRELFDPNVADTWPKGDFVCTAVDADTGEFVVLRHDSNTSLADAVASSICVPGIFPPVEVNGRRLVDGGLRSGTNADLATGHHRVLVLAPIGSRSDGMDPAAARAADEEIRALTDSGSICTLIFPDDTANDIIGINRMDESIAVAVMTDGRRQGRLMADRLADRW
jgi:NTE family protein